MLSLYLNVQWHLFVLWQFNSHMVISAIWRGVWQASVIEWEKWKAVNDDSKLIIISDFFLLCCGHFVFCEGIWSICLARIFICVLGCKRIESFSYLSTPALFFFSLVLPSSRWNKFHCYCVCIYSRPHVPPFRNTHTWKNKYTDFTWQREKEFFQCSYGTFAILVVCKY